MLIIRSLNPISFQSWTYVYVSGNYFCFSQELALLHHKTRSATVLCKDEVSLLAVCREVGSPLSVISCPVLFRFSVFNGGKIKSRTAGLK